MKKNNAKKEKYVRALFSIPDDTYLEFKKMTNSGERSQIITGFMKQYIATHKPQKKKSFWDDIDKYVKGDYSNEDPVKATKDAWKNIIDRL